MAVKNSLLSKKGNVTTSKQKSCNNMGVFSNSNIRLTHSMKREHDNSFSVLLSRDWIKVDSTSSVFMTKDLLSHFYNSDNIFDTIIIAQKIRDSQPRTAKNVV